MTPAQAATAVVDGLSWPNAVLDELERGCHCKPCSDQKRRGQPGHLSDCDVHGGEQQVMAGIWSDRYAWPNAACTCGAVLVDEVHVCYECGFAYSRSRAEEQGFLRTCPNCGL